MNPVAQIPRATSTVQFQFVQCLWPRESVLQGSLQFCTLKVRILKVLTLSENAKVKQYYHSYNTTQDVLKISFQKTFAANTHNVNCKPMKMLFFFWNYSKFNLKPIVGMYMVLNKKHFHHGCVSWILTCRLDQSLKKYIWAVLLYVEEDNQLMYVIIFKQRVLE